MKSTLRIVAVALVAVALVAPLTACKSGASDPGTKAAPAGDATHIPISITEKGFEPAKVVVKKGVATTLIFTRTTDATCAKEVVVPVGDQKIVKALPLNQPVELAVTFPEAGEVQYACGMDMLHAVITVQ
jgi:plastocyanin domain-containing protein